MFGLFSKDEKKIQELIDSRQFDELPTEVIDEIAGEIILTTESVLSGYDVVERLEIITAECVFGMNMFRDWFAGIRDIFGGRSSASQKVLRDARRVCLTELRREALLAGANAVIAVDLDYNEISGEGKSMLFLVATGTACRVEAN
ncbi:MAG: YbjQ family protein [Rhodospirillales bacterium]|nr:YbjQ family protein [Alphaproteobacteria bacterium]MBL6947673.1 YbjQ family protein [Rhodospirillales bacterium]